MQNKFITICTIAAFAIVIGTMLSGNAFAKIKAVDTSCQNPSGQQPGGQQPTCQGQGLTQNTENQNPAGKAPAGQNK